MIKRMTSFLEKEDGAVTVDWVVLTAGVCFIGTVVVTSVLNASTDVSNGIGANITSNGNDLLDP